jgi:hypothetical protein
MPAHKYNFAIERGDRASVLRQLSLQTKLQVITQFNVEESETDQLGPFVGWATVDAALQTLLADTDLTYIWQDQYTLRIAAKWIQPPRGDDTPAPMRVYGRREMERYGISSVADFSRYLTQQPFAFSEGYLQSGAKFIQMRGLGFDTTLVLINGHRVPPSANSISLNVRPLAG